MNLHKVLNLLIIGELFGLHNPNQIAAYFGITGNSLYKSWRKLSDQKIMDVANGIFWTIFQNRFAQLCRKSDATWSRSQVTLVIDSSIYKHYLSSPDEGNDEIGQIYDTFFSGQYGCAVYGFRLTLIGLTIDGIFYPINFFISAKKFSETQVANTLVQRIGRKLEALKTRENIDFPNLYSSADNSFCWPEFFEANTAIGVKPISVPKKNWLFEIGKKTLNLKTYIQRLEEQGLSDDKPVRVRAHRKDFGEVVLVFFKLKKGKKINVIMTTDLEAKAKTIRHRWFQRTYIEQFFRFSKHILKIQETKSVNVNQFVRKVALNFIKVILCQILYRRIESDFFKQILMNYNDLLQMKLLVTC